MVKKVLAICALLLVPGLDSYGCNRCGLFGRFCRYYKSPVAIKQVVVPAAVVKQADVFVVQNNYPPAIAAQGNTVYGQAYGYQAAAQAYFVNPAEVLRQSAELSKAASATATIGLSGYSQLANTQLALQASISEPLARGHAASQVLTAAGFTAPAAQTQSLALKITQNASGQWQVISADPVQVNAQVSAALGAESVPPAPQAPTSNSVIAQKCSRCHGLNLTEPKGATYLDAGHKLSCDAVVKALKMIKSGKMPPPDAQPLTANEKGLILDELLTLQEINP